MALRRNDSDVEFDLDLGELSEATDSDVSQHEEYVEADGSSLNVLDAAVQQQRLEVDNQSTLVGALSLEELNSSSFYPVVQGVVQPSERAWESPTIALSLGGSHRAYLQSLEAQSLQLVTETSFDCDGVFGLCKLSKLARALKQALQVWFNPSIDMVRGSKTSVAVKARRTQGSYWQAMKIKKFSAVTLGQVSTSIGPQLELFLVYFGDSPEQVLPLVRDSVKTSLLLDCEQHHECHAATSIKSATLEQARGPGMRAKPRFHLPHDLISCFVSVLCARLQEQDVDPKHVLVYARTFNNKFFTIKVASGLASATGIAAAVREHLAAFLRPLAFRHLEVDICKHVTMHVVSMRGEDEDAGAASSERTCSFLRRSFLSSSCAFSKGQSLYGLFGTYELCNAQADFAHVPASSVSSSASRSRRVVACHGVFLRKNFYSTTKNIFVNRNQTPFPYPRMAASLLACFAKGKPIPQQALSLLEKFEDDFGAAQLLWREIANRNHGVRLEGTVLYQDLAEGIEELLALEPDLLTLSSSSLSGRLENLMQHLRCIIKETVQVLLAGENVNVYQYALRLDAAESLLANFVWTGNQKSYCSKYLYSSSEECLGLTSCIRRCNLLDLSRLRPSRPANVVASVLSQYVDNLAKRRSGPLKSEADILLQAGLALSHQRQDVLAMAEVVVLAYVRHIAKLCNRPAEEFKLTRSYIASQDTELALDYQPVRAEVALNTLFNVRQLTEGRWRKSFLYVLKSFMALLKSQYGMSEGSASKLIVKAARRMGVEVCHCFGAKQHFWPRKFFFMPLDWTQYDASVSNLPGISAQQQLLSARGIAAQERSVPRPRLDHESKMWTDGEVIRLVYGMARYGCEKNKWRAVQDAKLVKEYRTNVHIKDKWRQLTATNVSLKIKAERYLQDHPDEDLPSLDFTYAAGQGASVLSAPCLVASTREGHVPASPASPLVPMAHGSQTSSAALSPLDAPEPNHDGPVDNNRRSSRRLSFSSGIDESVSSLQPWHESGFEEFAADPSVGSVAPEASDLSGMPSSAAVSVVSSHSEDNMTSDDIDEKEMVTSVVRTLFLRYGRGKTFRLEDALVDMPAFVNREFLQGLLTWGLDNGFVLSFDGVHYRFSSRLEPFLANL